MTAIRFRPTFTQPGGGWRICQDRQSVGQITWGPAEPGAIPAYLVEIAGQRVAVERYANRAKAAARRALFGEETI